MELMKIDEAKCTQCGICAEICPLLLIDMSEKTGLPATTPGKAARCINCGHCEAACPYDAFKHISPEDYTFPATENHETSITSDDLCNYFQHRRSIRNYNEIPVEKEKFEKIFDIARYAPSGINYQPVKWLVIYDTQKVKALGHKIAEWMQECIANNHPLNAALGLALRLRAYQNGFDVITRGAPHLIISYTESNHPSFKTDAIIATSHLELTLPAFGLGGCWAGYIMMGLNNKPELLEFIGLSKDYLISGVMMIGYPKYRYSHIPARKKANVLWIN